MHFLLSCGPWQLHRPPSWGRSVGAAAFGLGGALFLAHWIQHCRPEAFWFACSLATIWLWQLVFSASCLAAGHWAVSRWIPAHDRGRLDTLAISFPVGVAIFVLGMYVGGFLHLFGPVFAVAWPALLLICHCARHPPGVDRTREAASRRPSI